MCIRDRYYDNENVILVQSKNLRFTFEEPVAWTRDGEAGGVTTEMCIRDRFLGFPVQYLFWLHNMVAEGGLEPPTSGL